MPSASRPASIAVHPGLVVGESGVGARVGDAAVSEGDQVLSRCQATREVGRSDAGDLVGAAGAVGRRAPVAASPAEGGKVTLSESSTTSITAERPDVVTSRTQSTERLTPGPISRGRRLTATVTPAWVAASTTPLRTSPSSW